MNNIILDYIKRILLDLGSPEEEVQAISEHIFLITLEKTLPEVVTKDEIDKFVNFVNSKDELGLNSFIASLPQQKFQSIFIIKLQDTLKSFFETILTEFNEVERKDFLDKFQKLVTEESLTKYKDLAPNDFLKSISK